MGDDVLSFLSELDIFEAFTPSELAQVAQEVSEICLDRNAVLFQEGDQNCMDLFVLVEGELKVYKKNRALTVIQPVDYIGEMAIIEQKPRSATVVATQPSRLLKLTSKHFNDYLNRQPQPVVTLMRSLSNRIRRDNELIASEFETANILIHDMRNLLSGFLLLDLMEKKHTFPEEVIRFFQVMRKSRRDLAELMEEALANAKRLQFFKPLANNSLRDLASDLAQLELANHPDFRDRTLAIDIAPDLPDFPFHRLDLRRVLANLAINAAQASGPGQTVSIRARLEEEHSVRIEVEDHGCGIPPEIHDRIFLSRFTTKPDGNGLGLASCKEIIARHQGCISFESVSGQGTTFAITLPLSPTPRSTG